MKVLVDCIAPSFSYTCVASFDECGTQSFDLFVWLLLTMFCFPCVCGKKVQGLKDLLACAEVWPVAGTDDGRRAIIFCHNYLNRTLGASIAASYDD